MHGNKLKHIISITLVVIVAHWLPVQADINKYNWVLHPDIVKIREIYKGVVTKVENGELRRRIKSCSIEDGRGEIDVKVYSSDGTVEMYAYGAGNAESSAEGKYYYYKGNLVFTFISHKTTWGGHSEIRVYFDQETNVIYEDDRVLESGAFKGNLPKKILSPNEHFESQCT